MHRRTRLVLYLAYWNLGNRNIAHWTWLSVFKCHNGGHTVEATKRTLYLEIPRHPVGQFLGILRHLVVEVYGGRVLQQLVLLVDRLHNFRVAVAHAHRHYAGKRLPNSDTNRKNCRRTAEMLK